MAPAPAVPLRIIYSDFEILRDHGNKRYCPDIEGAGKRLLLRSKSNEISKAAAYRLYGRSDVDRWIAEGLVLVIDKKLGRQKLADVVLASNWITYLPSKDR